MGPKNKQVEPEVVFSTGGWDSTERWESEMGEGCDGN